MTIKCISTSSDGNSFILTNDSGKHLMIEAGLPIGELKKGIDFDVENWQGLIVSHGHADHALSADKVRKIGIPVWEPYKDTEHKRLRTKLGDFQIESFPVPHNGCENRGFLIKTEEQTVCFLVDLEYLPYDMSSQKIDTLIVECNYITELVNDDIPNIRHKCLGHCSLDTTIGIIKNCQKHLKQVYLIHASKGVTMDRANALERIRQEIPAYINVNFCHDEMTYNISLCPF